MGAIEGAPQRRSLRDQAISLLIQFALFVIIFGWLLPKFIDYQEVWDAIQELTWWEFLILLAIGIARIPTEAMIYRALLPGLHMRVGTEAYLSQNFAGTFLPPPTSSIVQYAYFRSDAFEERPALIGAVGSFIFPSAGRMAMPIVALVFLTITGYGNPEAFWIAAVSVAVLLIAAVVIWLVGRSDRSARWVGDQSGRLISAVLAIFRRKPVTGVGDMFVSFRMHTYAIVKQRWLAGSIAVTINLFVTYILLLVSLRFVGLSQSDISASQIFAALSVGFFAGAVLPLTSSGLGTVDAIIISALTAMAGDSNSSLCAAGEFVWRIFYSILAVPVGVFTLNRFRRKNGSLLTEAWHAAGSMGEALSEGDAGGLPEVPAPTPP
jgi:uncharacterized membrane protein YbhN (UPF0104 family)